MPASAPAALADQSNPLPIRFQPLPCRRKRILILVDPDQSAGSRKPTRHLVSMSAAAKGAVQIDALRFDVQIFYGFFKEH
jgi:hypothetical protein